METRCRHCETPIEDGDICCTGAELDALRVVAIALIDSEYCADGYRNISVGEDEFAALKDAVRSA